MKKMVFGLLSVSLVLAVSSTKLSAQESSYARTASTSELTSTNVEGRTLNSAEVINIAVEDFSKKHKNASDVEWSKSAETFSVYFKENKSNVRCTYDLKGNLEYTLRYLKGAQIPRYITNDVRRNEYYMDITQVIEVKRKNVLSHFVKMEDSRSFLTLLVQNGEVQVYENITKAK